MNFQAARAAILDWIDRRPQTTDWPTGGAAAIKAALDDARLERTLDYVDVLEDCFGYALALLAASSQEQADSARAGLNAAMAKGPSTQMAAAEAGVVFRDPAMRSTPPMIEPMNDTKH